MAKFGRIVVYYYLIRVSKDCFLNKIRGDGGKGQIEKKLLDKKNHLGTPTSQGNY